MWRPILGVALLLSGCGESSDDTLPPRTFGSAVITWTLADSSGNPLSCEALDLTDTSVSLGRDTVVVPCGEEQRATFPMLTPGRYGVTIRLEIAGRGALISQTDNIDVVADQEATRDIQVVVDTVSLQRGSIMFRWTIAGLPAAANCGALGAETIHIATDPSSSEPFGRDVPCRDGQLLIDPLEAGVYEGRAEMRDAEGVAVGLPQTFDIRVRGGEQSVHTIAFFQISADLATFHGRWTITSSSAADACEDVDGDRVRISLQTLPRGRQGVEIATATAACALGEVTIPDLLGGSNQLRATFLLISDLVGPLDTTTSTAFYLVAGRTSTVSADFDLQ